MDLFETMFLREMKSPIMFNVAFSITRNYFEAKDLLQETAYQAWRARHTFQPGSNMGAWLNTICRNTFRNQLLKPANRVKVRFVEEPEIYSSDVVYNDASEFEEMEIQRMRQKQMYAGIARLPVHMKEVVLMRLDGIRVKDVATTLNTSRGTISSRMNKSQVYLRQIISTGRIVGRSEMPVSQYSPDGITLINKFKSVQDAAKKTGVCIGNIYSVVSGIGKTGAGKVRTRAGKYVWRKS